MQRRSIIGFVFASAFVALLARAGRALDLAYTPPPTPGSGPQGQLPLVSMGDMLWTGTSVLLVVGLVILTYRLLIKWRNRQGSSSEAAGLINVLERQYLDVRHGLAVVEVGEEILALGLGEDVTLLSRISDPETVERLRARARPPAGATGFREQLQKIGLRLKREEWGQAKQSMRDEAEELKKQAEKLSRRRKGES